MLVDDAGTTQPGVPAMRKIPLAMPAMAAPAPAPMAAAAAPMWPAAAVPGGAGTIFSRLRKLAVPGRGPRGPASTGLGAPPRTQFDFAWTIDRIDWAEAPEKLRRGELDGLEPAIAQAILAAAGVAGIGSLARSLGVPPAAIVLALLARARGNRAALRFFRAVLGTADPRLVDEAARALGV